MNDSSVAREFVRLVESRKASVDLPSRSQAEAAMRRGLRLRRGRRLAVAAVAVVLTAGATIPLWTLSGLIRPEVGGTAAGADTSVPMAINVPDGWNAEAIMQGPTLGPVLRAANFPLPAPEGDFHGGISRTMPRDGVVVAIQELVGICGCRGFEDVSLPLTLVPGELSPFGENRLAMRAFSTYGHYFTLYVELGPASSLKEANDVLGSLTLGGAWSPSPETLANQVPAPEFGDGRGWNVAARTASPQGEVVPIAWASTVPFAAQDLEPVAQLGWLPFPTETVRGLPEDGIVIVVTLLLPSQLPAPPDNPNFPDRELPLQISDAEVATIWEGQIAPNIPEYKLRARVNHQYVDVRIYFGSLNPSATTLQAAQAQLETLSIPGP